VTQPLEGHFKRAGVAPRRFLREFRVESPEEFTLGDAISVETLKECDFVDVMAISIGKGFQGVIKRHNFAGGPATHGSGFHRSAGSTGMRSSPGRCFLGGKRAGHMGSEQVTVQSLRVFRVDVEDNLLLVVGGVPGAKGALVTINTAVKKIKN
jgi:large subunit ribosomal protein L3